MPRLAERPQHERIKSTLKDSRLRGHPIRDCNYSLDIKGFAKNHKTASPFLGHHKQLSRESHEKASTPTPGSVSLNFSSHVSHKQITVKKRLSVAKSNNNSISIDKHLIKQKYNNVKELICGQKYLKAIPAIRHILAYCEYSEAQKNLYLWLALSLMKTGKPRQALEQVLQCHSIYSQSYESLICLGRIEVELHRLNEAIATYHKACQINPKSTTAYKELSECLKQTKEYDKAVQLLKKGYDKSGKSPEILAILIQHLINIDSPECKLYMKEAKEIISNKDSVYLCLCGLLEKKRNNVDQSYILFEEALKYNNNRAAVTDALLQILQIELERRDYYKAHHTISRSKHLDVEPVEEIGLYELFVEGVITMMKKKYKEALQLLLKAAQHKNVHKLNLAGLINKYLGYGYFKEGQHDKSIKQYQKIPAKEKDRSSDYNLLLAEGIEMVDRLARYDAAIECFEKAKLLYPLKVEPYLYVAITHIRCVCVHKQRDSEQMVQAMTSALREMDQAYETNYSSSNLLYHRAMLHLYFEDWHKAQQDINGCIEKAEENLPKYFYLRGISYYCAKEFKKAINQFSICISLASNHAEAYLEKSKCSFLLGDTEKGFSNLKTFMELRPDDISIYKWIGDLLYEGESYRDALKAYSELGDLPTCDLDIMRCKCLLRVGSLLEVMQLLKAMENKENNDKSKWQVDMCALGMVFALQKGENKQISSFTRKLNQYLESNTVGSVFQLIDCMNLLGVAAFYLEKYNEAYQSFLLVMELYRSLTGKNQIALRSEINEGDLDLSLDDILLNLVLSELAQNHLREAVRILNEEYSNDCQPKQSKKIDKLLSLLMVQKSDCVQIDQRSDKPINYKLKKVDIFLKHTRFKCKPSFNLFHDNASCLYSSPVAAQMITNLKLSDIDNMPEGPWIKRNAHGVIFTEEIFPTEYSLSLVESSRASEHNKVSQEEERAKAFSNRKEEFLRRLKLDEEVESKLNSLMPRNDRRE